MANSINGRQWVLDMNQVPVKTGRAWVTGMRWRDYGAASDEVQVFDGIRNVMVAHFKGRSDLAPVETVYTHPQQIQSFSLPVITSGKLEVFVY